MTLYAFRRWEVCVQRPELWWQRDDAGWALALGPLVVVYWGV